MKNHVSAIFWGFVLLANFGYAAEDPCSELAQTFQTKELEDFIAANFCALAQLSLSVPEKTNALAKEGEASGQKVVGIYTEPTERGGTYLRYKIPERNLAPGEAMYFGVPVDLSMRPIRFAILGHRQDPSAEQGWDESSKWDNKPGLTSMQFHSADKRYENKWRYWAGSASGSNGSKFAEVRSQPELENLYEWRKNGHRGVNTHSTETGELKVDGIRLINTGKDNVLISEVQMKVSAPPADRHIQEIFSKGTMFGNAETGEGYSYGGGQAHKGKFPNALALSKHDAIEPIPKLPAGWIIKRGALHIPLPAGISLSELELAVGDSHPDLTQNKDGGWGKPGWAKLSAYIRKPSGDHDVLIDKENLPPEGIIMGSPKDPCYITGAGETLVIKVHSDVAYIMGLRIGLRDNK